MALTAKQACDLLTPYVQHVLIKNQKEFQDATHDYFSSKGLLSGLGSVFASTFFWTFILQTVLPFLIKVALFVVIALFAPYLTFLEPFLDGLIDLLDQSLLSLQQKQLAKDIIALFRIPANTLPVDTNITQPQRAHLLAQQEPLECFCHNSTNSLFTR